MEPEILATSLQDRLDRFGRRHPRLFLAAMIVIAIATTLILIYNTKDTAIVYRAF
jgi:hypothetical protein